MTETAGSREDAAAIEVSCHKLLDWLLAATLIKPNWPQQLSALSARIDAVLPLLPPSVTAQLSLSSLPFTYDSALQAVQLITASASAPSRVDWLGRAADPALRSLLSLLSAYRRHNLRLAHSAQLLQQYAAFDIPEARRTIQACALQTAELQRRLVDSRKAAEAARDRQRRECEAVGVKAAERADAEIRRQVVAALQQLPGLLQSVQEWAKSAAVGDALLLYDGWMQWMQRDEKAAQRDRQHRLTALREMRERQLEQPQQQEESKQKLAQDSAAELQAGDAQTGQRREEAAAAASWDIRMEAAGEDRGELAAPLRIDWSSAADTAEHRNDQPEQLRIDWEADGSTAAQPSPSPTTAAAAAAAALPASLQSDSTGLLSPAFRSRFQSELSELSAFLASRLSDLTLSAASLSPLASQLVSSCPAALSPCFSASSLSRLLQSVAAVEEALQGKSLQRLLRLAAGEGELERAVSAVFASRLSAERAEAAVRQLQDRLEAARLRREKEAVRLREMEAASISWRRSAEDAIAQLLKRAVSIRD